MRDTASEFASRARQLPYRRLALIAGLLSLGAVLVLNVPGMADARRYPSPAMAFSHLAATLTALGLSARFRGWVVRAAALSTRQQVLYLVGALVGPLIVMVAFLAVAPTYGHALFTREWGIVEPLQFVLWLTAAWLAFERARFDGPGTPSSRAFRLAGWACILLALEEIDYFGIVTMLAKAGGAPRGRIGGHHIGGFHDLINAAGSASLLLGLFAIVVVLALLSAWFVSAGLHRVVVRELWSPTAWPLVGAVGFMAIAQLADIDHPVVKEAFGQLGVVRELREEPMELLAVMCVNACLLAKLAPLVRRPREATGDR